MYTKAVLVALLLNQGLCVVGQELKKLKHNPSKKQQIDDIVIDEVQDVHVKQHVLIDRNYNSSFTVSIPMLTVVVPGQKESNGVVRLSVSQITLWSLIWISFIGLMYPVFLGPHGKLHRRNFDGQSYLDEAFRFDPTILDHIDRIVNITQIYEDIITLVPWEVSQDCLSRSVCEAHENVLDFGLAGMALRGVYSIEENGLLGATSKMTRKAASNGQNPNVKCEDIYSRCMVSPLEMYKKILTYFLDE